MIRKVPKMDHHLINDEPPGVVAARQFDRVAIASDIGVVPGASDKRIVVELIIRRINDLCLTLIICILIPVQGIVAVAAEE